MAIWIVGFSLFSFLPPDSPFRSFYPLIKTSYGSVCHQQPNKSFIVNGSHFLVCSRCTGIYLGGFIAMSLSVFTMIKSLQSRSFKYFTAFSLIMFIDVLINNFILTEYNKTSAFFTGYLFSFFAVYFVIFEIKRNNFFHRYQRDN